jgi:nucleotide-binding universal stress UspA family protein
MTRYLLATASVHTTAAAADYLDGRLGAGFVVVVVTVDEPGVPARDAADAVNVARSRLLPATVTVEERTGDPAEAVRTVLSEREVDELLVGPRRGDPDAERGDPDAGRGGDDGRGETVGSTARAILGTVDVPVVVVPLAEL